MMGTSLLSVPWALSQSGIVMGLIIACGMFIVSVYTALLVLRTHKKESEKLSNANATNSFNGVRFLIAGLHGFIPEFAQMCGRLMGSFWEYLGSFFSLIAITGAAVVYWVLMSNFLYNTVTFIYGKVTFVIVMKFRIINCCNFHRQHNRKFSRPW
jgi:sodium-coupled neutral amino acid transporter 9